MHSEHINLVTVCAVFEWLLLPHIPTLIRNVKLFSLNKSSSTHVIFMNIMHFVIVNLLCGHHKQRLAYIRGTTGM